MGHTLNFVLSNPNDAADEIERLQDAKRRALAIADERAKEANELRLENARLRAALEEIRDHWANEYDHPRKENEMYRGPYGIGVTDGHRACTIIAEKALSKEKPDRNEYRLDGTQKWQS